MRTRRRESALDFLLDSALFCLAPRTLAFLTPPAPWSACAPRIKRWRRSLRANVLFMWVRGQTVLQRRKH
jgi:hypothetical protein